MGSSAPVRRRGSRGSQTSAFAVVSAGRNRWARQAQDQQAALNNPEFWDTQALPSYLDSGSGVIGLVNYVLEGACQGTGSIVTDVQARKPACKRALQALWVLSSGKDRALRAAGGPRVKHQSQKTERYDKFQKSPPKAPSNAVSMVMCAGPFLRVRKCFLSSALAGFSFWPLRETQALHQPLFFKQPLFISLFPLQFCFFYWIIFGFHAHCSLFLLPSSCFIFNFLSRILSPFT